jgi:hypothetical protein
MKREKKAVEAYFKTLSQYAWGDRTTSVKIVGVLIEVRTGHLPNTSRGFTV